MKQQRRPRWRAIITSLVARAQRSLELVVAAFQALALERALDLGELAGSRALERDIQALEG